MQFGHNSLGMRSKLWFSTSALGFQKYRFLCRLSGAAVANVLSRREQRVQAGRPFDEAAQIAHRHLRNLAQGFDGEKPLVTGHQDVGKAHQSLKELVVDDLAGMVLKKQLAFLLAHIDSQAT